MRFTFLVTASTLICLIAAGVEAADKSKIETLINAARINMETIATKAGDNKAVAADLAQAKMTLKKAEETLEKGLIWRFGDIKPEAEQECKHYIAMAELVLSIAQTRLEALRAEAEAEALSKLLTTAKNRIKRFDDRKAELEKLRGDALKFQGLIKEVESVRAEKAILASQIEQLKAENVKLAEQLEKLKTDRIIADGQKEDVNKNVVKPDTAAPSLPREPAQANSSSSDTVLPVYKYMPAVKEPLTIKDTPSAR